MKEGDIVYYHNSAYNIRNIGTDSHGHEAIKIVSIETDTYPDEIVYCKECELKGIVTKLNPGWVNYCDVFTDQISIDDFNEEFADQLKSLMQ